MPIRKVWSIWYNLCFCQLFKKALGVNSVYTKGQNPDALDDCQEHTEKEPNKNLQSTWQRQESFSEQGASAYRTKAMEAQKKEFLLPSGSWKDS